MTKHEILEPIIKQGVYTHHSLDHLIKEIESHDEEHQFNLHDFEELASSQDFFKKVLAYGLTIPFFGYFENSFDTCFNEIKNDTVEYQGGKVATYIPPLARADPNWFASSFCSADG